MSSSWAIPFVSEQLILLLCDDGFTPTSRDKSNWTMVGPKKKKVGFQ